MPSPEIIAAVKAHIESKPRTLDANPVRESAPIDSQPISDSQDTTQNKIDLMYLKGIHTEVYKYFDIHPAMANKSQLSQMKFLSDLLFSNPSQGLRKLLDTELKFGKNLIPKENLTRLFNWFRIRGN